LTGCLTQVPPIDRPPAASLTETLFTVGPAGVTLGRNRVCSSRSEEKRSESLVADLDTKDREKLDKRKFAYVDKEGEGHLPINDDAHVRNAMARFNQTDFESGTKKETARKKIVKAAKRRGIEVAKGDNVATSRKAKR
jgi:hypothetical protein